MVKPSAMAQELFFRGNAIAIFIVVLSSLSRHRMTSNIVLFVVAASTALWLCRSRMGRNETVAPPKEEAVEAKEEANVSITIRYCTRCKW